MKTEDLVEQLLHIRCCLVNIQREVSLNLPLDWSVKEAEHAITLIDALINDSRKRPELVKD